MRVKQIEDLPMATSAELYQLSWVIEQLMPAHSFIALPVAASHPAQDLVVEVRRGPLTVKVSWPLTAASDCAAWMRELLR